jgi:hypothetical protein
MEYVVVFCDNLELFTAISYTLRSFGIYFLVLLPTFGPRKILQP